MLTILGILLLLIGGADYFITKRQNAIEEQNVKIRERNELSGSRVDKGTTIVTPSLIPGKPLYYFITGIVVLGLNGLFFWANAGTAYAVQYPWGGDKLIKTQGLKFKGYGRTIPLSYEMSIKDIIPKVLVDSDGNRVLEKLPKSEDGIYNRVAHRWEFSDAIKADIAIAVIVGVNTDDESQFLEMADKNRSESKLIYGRVIPNIDAALKNTAKLMDAQEYISGKASDFDRYFRDQLQNGMYMVEEYIEEEMLPEIIGDTSTVRTISSKSNVNKQTKYRIKRDNQGNIIRDNNSNTLSQYGVTVFQANVTGIDWEASFDKRLDLQKDQVAQTQLEKQEAEKEFYRAKKEIAKGESEKAAERAKLEKEQIKLTIAAETEAKVAVQNVVAEKQKLQVAKLQAQSKKVAADAQFYENAKLVQAGLTPQERAELELQKATAVANAFSKMAAPNTVIIGGGKSSSPTEALIQANMAKQLMGEN